MEDIEVKVLDNNVCVGYTSLFDAGESFYGEFNLREYKQKLNDFKKDHKFEIAGNNGKLKLLYKGKDIYVILSRNGNETQFSEKALSDKFFI
jgi:hypothetical protein